jgi:hypothetical protein
MAVTQAFLTTNLEKKTPKHSKILRNGRVAAEINDFDAQT